MLLRIRESRLATRVYSRRGIRVREIHIAPKKRELAVGGKCDGSSGRVLLARPIVAAQRYVTS
jgi:hypothetical protein